jgi:cytochrome c
MHRHMPKDKLVSLTEQQAYDVAAFVTGHARPDFAGKENDWPGGDPPPDAAYATAKKRSGARQE